MRCDCTGSSRLGIDRTWNAIVIGVGNLARALLRYRGFMCQASYNYLHKLSHDPEYETAIDQLYMGSALGDRRGSWRWAVLLAVALIVAAGIWVLWHWLH